MSYFIAEIGYNHNGSLEKAFRLVESLKDFKLVKFIKFQIDPPAEIYHPKYGRKYFELFERISLTLDEYIKLWDKIIEIGKIPMFSTSSPEVVSNFPRPLKYLKIASGSVFNFPIYEAAKRRRELETLFVSLGAVNLEEIKILHSYLKDKNLNVRYLHCVSRYPTHPLESNLNRIEILKEFLGGEIGYSDHTATKEVIYSAFLLGANPIEMHVMLDNDLEAVEKEVSYEISALKEIENKILEWLKFEKKEEKFNFIRRAIYTRRDLKSGERLTLNKVIFLRPFLGKGHLKDVDWLKIQGKTLKKDKNAYEPIYWEDLE